MDITSALCSRSSKKMLDTSVRLCYNPVGEDGRSANAFALTDLRPQSPPVFTNSVCRTGVALIRECMWSQRGEERSIGVGIMPIQGTTGVGTRPIWNMLRRTVGSGGMPILSMDGTGTRPIPKGSEHTACVGGSPIQRRSAHATAIISARRSTRIRKHGAGLAVVDVSKVMAPFPLAHGKASSESRKVDVRTA